MLNPYRTLEGLPSTEQLLTEGDDERLMLDPLSGLNKYGCQPFPDPQLLAFGSSTSSVISKEGFAAANRLHQKLQKAIGTEPHAIIYAREIERIRSEWLRLCELSDLAGLELIPTPSGTDVHALAAQYVISGTSKSTLAIMVETNETGRGVASALNANANIGNHAMEVVQVPIRLGDGTPRPSTEIDTQIEILVNNAVASDRHILLILVDQSKTGLIAPSPACVMKLCNHFPDNITVLVDACQFRITMPTLRAYLEQGFMVALTGSKFLSGPSFSAALLLPPTVTERRQERTVLRNLQPDSFNESSMISCAMTKYPDHMGHFGFLLRCEAALEELREFRTVPQAAITDFLQAFAEAIQQRLLSDPHFEPLPVPQLDRGPLIEGANWDHLQTIFPFLLYYPQQPNTERIPLNLEEARHVYQQLQTSFNSNSKIAATRSSTASIPNSGSLLLIRCQLGQPVLCGTRNGITVSALRLCVSSRVIIDAVTSDDKGLTVIKNAQMALDKTVLLIQNEWDKAQLNNQQL